ncbi:hypothetical protein CkaCkLH20_04219 [Colletotrichum karsti]|uniref:Beta-xylosidase n=1 Tax=Colletotrichum karsti TaxID=1095194 RepID=A0A9P6ICT4_9PEZI|nr:uncharacterized protein CkaCkLH20_04219 [Colletotrichum karsti]KAF9878181.1 hypothetical protein CkaCkLH20_04219 [Colletotrichum karsti]
MSLIKTTSVFLAICANAFGRVTSRAPSGAATMDLGTLTGQARFLGSGFIYGFPDNGTSIDTSIPDYLVTDIKFHASRAGGAQIPAKGWVGGYEEYLGRFNSALSNYRTTRKFGGDFILLPHDLWGSDGSLGTGSPLPGDNGDWTSMEQFLRQVTNDIKANGMLEGLVFDIWNEPELDLFWPRSWEQYLEYYVRAHRIIREELPGTLISGPSGAHAPAVDRSTWDTWMATVSANDAIPDIYSWHQIGIWERDPDRTVADFHVLRTKHNLPERPIDLNEYAWPDEQNPAGAVFYLSQLERHNLRGLRANWGGGSDLHNFLADLVYENADGSYGPNGEWEVYKYYAQMTGERISTAASPDLLFDVFGTVEGGNVKVLAGTRVTQAPYEIKISGLSKFGLPVDGSIAVRSLRFDWAGRKTQVGGPVDLGTSVLTYSADTLVLLVDPPTNSTAFAYEFSVATSA